MVVGEENTPETMIYDINNLLLMNQIISMRQITPSTLNTKWKFQLMLMVKASSVLALNMDTVVVSAVMVGSSLVAK